MEPYRISEQRLVEDIERIASWNQADPVVGYHRPTFSPSWAAAREYLIAEVHRAGGTVRSDPVGNLHARPAGLDWETPAWLCGSHLDSVPTGGRYDGVVGVVVALEILRSHPEVPLEMVVFAEEEGTAFGIALLGSRAWAGTIDPDQLLNLKNREGLDFGTAGAPFGVDAGRLRSGAFGFALGAYRGMVEVHVEQGASLWNRGQALAVVTTVNGRQQSTGQLTGVANHAGSTAMADRFDALAGMAEVILGLESLAGELHRRCLGATITVGRVVPAPNAINVIAGSVEFGLDFRANRREILAEGERRIADLVAEVAHRRGLGHRLDQFENHPAVPLDPGLCGRLHQAGSSLGMSLVEASSGALHDACILASQVPTAMVFVASRDGISHNPLEFSRSADIASAARVVVAALGR